MTTNQISLRIGLALSAAIWAASPASADDQQLEIVSFHEVDLGPGTHLVANPFANQVTNVAALFANAPDGTSIYKLVNGTYTTNTLTGSNWSQPAQTLNPGEAAFVVNPTTNTFRVRYVGQLLTGSLTNNIPEGLSLKSTIAYGSGPVTTTLGLHLTALDNLYLWRSNRFEVYTYLPSGSWTPSEPSVALAEGFLINAKSSTNWITTFQP